MKNLFNIVVYLICTAAKLLNIWKRNRLLTIFFLYLPTNMLDIIAKAIWYSGPVEHPDGIFGFILAFSLFIATENYSTRLYSPLPGPSECADTKRCASPSDREPPSKFLRKFDICSNDNSNDAGADNTTPMQLRESIVEETPSTQQPCTCKTV